MEKKPRSVALLSAGLLVGGAAVGALVVSAANAATAEPLVVSAANAATADPTLTASGSSAGGTAGAAGEVRPGDACGDGRGHNPDEKPVSAAVEAKLKAAALKAVPGGTVLRVETDSGDAVYEAHMKRSDGSLATVKFGTSFAVIGVEDGVGRGPHGPSSGQGRHGGPGSHGDRPSNGSDGPNA